VLSAPGKTYRAFASETLIQINSARLKGSAAGDANFQTEGITRACAFGQIGAKVRVAIFRAVVAHQSPKGGRGFPAF
jgi:hypothetical protein